jgi:hypothetical protein
MAWQGLVGVRVEKAVDERGRSLHEVVVTEPAAGQEMIVAGGRGGQRIVRRIHPNSMSGDPREVLVHLEQADRPAKRLQELSGVLAAQVRTAPEAIFSVDNILKAAGQSIRGDGGGKMTVTQVTPADNGEVALQIELELPPEVAPVAGGGMESLVLPGPGGRRGGAGFQGRAGITRALAASPVIGFRLLDDKGAVLPLNLQQVTGKAEDETVTWQVTLAHKKEAGQGEPAKLAFFGSRTLTLDIPFTLKDVPLP